MIILDVEQGSQEWLEARAGVITCSELSTIFAKGKGEVFGKIAITYMYELIGEQITGEPKPSFSNAHTERGHEDETVAIELYEMQTLTTVTKCGFIKADKIGYSPDGLVGGDGLIECKSRLPKFQAELIYTQEMPQEHIWQCHGGLYASGRKWIDYVSYCSGMPMFVKRVHRDEEIMRQIDERVDLFLTELERRKGVILG
jgi:predicted phage-related endonuclease